MTAFDLDAALDEVATHLAQRRPQLLARWRKCVTGDAEIAGDSLMTRTQFYNHMPWLLESFGRKLKTASRTALDAQQEREAEIAQQHSHHRWQQGYSMRSLVREWGHLNTAMVELLNEIPAPEPALARTRVLWAEFVNHSISEGVSEYQSQLQIEAKGRLKDLEATVETVRGLEMARAEMLRQVSHDLRGSLSMVAGASSLLGRDAIGGSDREQVISIMQGGVRSVSQMLTHLMDVSRLEAGQEVLTIESFDAGQILQDLCNNSQMLADEKGLWMTIEGPESLPVEGDLSKVQRIAQNLLLNALKYTQSGGITVSWNQTPNNQWSFSVEDTGPGLNRSNAAPLARQIEQATNEAAAIGAQSPEFEADAPTSPREAAPSTPRAPDASETLLSALPGEGIGLSIVKRLCEVIGATLEIHSEDGQGSKIRVVLPRSYETESASQQPRTP